MSATINIGAKTHDGRAARAFLQLFSCNRIVYQRADSAGAEPAACTLLQAFADHQSMKRGSAQSIVRPTPEFATGPGGCPASETNDTSKGRDQDRRQEALGLARGGSGRHRAR